MKHAMSIDWGSYFRSTRRSFTRDRFRSAGVSIGHCFFSLIWSGTDLELENKGEDGKEKG